MIQLTENVNFRNELLLLFFTHLTVVEFLPNKGLPVDLPSNLANFAKRAYKSGKVSKYDPSDREYKNYHCLYRIFSRISLPFLNNSSTLILKEGKMKAILI